MKKIANIIKVNMAVSVTINFMFAIFVAFYFQSYAWASEEDRTIAFEAKALAPLLVSPYRNEAVYRSEQAGQFKQHYRHEAVMINNETQERRKYHLSQVENLKNTTDERNDSGRIIVFVSFSMPMQSLVGYLKDADKIHASVVIRGLVHNSFKETILQVGNVTKAASCGGVEINPPLFTKFAITQVPTVVVLGDTEKCLEKSRCLVEADFDKITGDISLPSALQEISLRGTAASDYARKMRDKLRGELYV